jgi:glutathionyl-hydroquinone reductase
LPFLVRVYERNNQRGYFKYWGHKKKYKLFNKGKRFHSYNAERPSFSGRFTKCSLLDKEYAQIKRQTLAEAFKEAKDRQKERLTPKQLQTEVIKKQVLANILGISRRYVYKIRNEAIMSGKVPLK